MSGFESQPRKTPFSETFHLTGTELLGQASFSRLTGKYVSGHEDYHAMNNAFEVIADALRKKAEGSKTIPVVWHVGVGYNAL